jgi:hypothetical protein
MSYNSIGSIIPNIESANLFRRAGIEIAKTPIEIQDWNRLIQFASTGLIESNRHHDYELARAIYSRYILVGRSIDEINCF